jgi:hypothetical protein
MRVVKAISETRHMFVTRFARAVLRVYMPEHVSIVTTAAGILGARPVLLIIRSPVAKRRPFVKGFGVVAPVIN